ncbi:hypothetical protein SAMN06272775_4644 [Streptomyces sp. 2323.1]|uniref:hypothetical protein n=1 Tax=Streptomyces TaxID=1883 RepID=UPI000BC0E8C4|nr:hypothetical protein [Streptomyces sp. 2323.1]SOE13668.1 hypothetical protein SAMN06272775_4644 [Streptomyces sp. 2323.1]
MFRKSPSPASEDNQNRSSDDLRREYALINRERAGGGTSPNPVADQNDIARELERRGEL